MNREMVAFKVIRAQKKAGILTPTQALERQFIAAFREYARAVIGTAGKCPVCDHKARGVK